MSVETRNTIEAQNGIADYPWLAVFSTATLSFRAMRGAYVGLILLWTLLVTGCTHPLPAYESHYAPRATPTTPQPAPITMPLNAKAVFIGDSWTEGYSATPETRGYAYLTQEAMGWTGPVYAAAGTGYTKGTKDGTVPAYAERIASLPTTDAQIVIVQGSVNDFDTDNFRDLPGKADQVIAAAMSKYPGAAVILLGPCPYSVPPTDTLRGVDAALRLAAQQNAMHYVSCYGEQWITAANIRDVIDPETAHPDTAGHAYLADRLVADLRSFITQG